MAPPILKMETKMGGLREETKNESGIDGQGKTSSHKTNTYHAMGKVTNNEINCIKLNPMDFAP
jgi:hypothetical protein